MHPLYKAKSIIIAIRPINSIIQDLLAVLDYNSPPNPADQVTMDLRKSLSIYLLLNTR